MTITGEGSSEVYFCFCVCNIRHLWHDESIYNTHVAQVGLKTRYALFTVPFGEADYFDRH